MLAPAQLCLERVWGRGKRQHRVIEDHDLAIKRCSQNFSDAISIHVVQHRGCMKEGPVVASKVCEFVPATALHHLAQREDHCRNTTGPRLNHQDKACAADQWQMQLTQPQQAAVLCCHITALHETMPEMVLKQATLCSDDPCRAFMW